MLVGVTSVTQPNVCLVCMARTCQTHTRRKLLYHRSTFQSLCYYVRLSLNALHCSFRGQTSPEDPKRRRYTPLMTSSLVSNPHPSLGVPDRAATCSHACCDAGADCCRRSRAAGEVAAVRQRRMQNQRSCPAGSDSYRG